MSVMNSTSVKESTERLPVNVPLCPPAEDVLNYLLIYDSQSL